MHFIYISSQAEALKKQMEHLLLVSRVDWYSTAGKPTKTSVVAICSQHNDVWLVASDGIVEVDGASSQPLQYIVFG